MAVILRRRKLIPADLAVSSAVRPRAVEPFLTRRMGDHAVKVNDPSGAWYADSMETIKLYLLAQATKLLENRRMTVDELRSFLAELPPHKAEVFKDSIALVMHAAQFVLLLWTRCLFVLVVPEGTDLPPVTNGLYLLAFGWVGFLACRAGSKVIMALGRSVDQDEDDIEE